jgi:hypothetical protein
LFPRCTTAIDHGNHTDGVYECRNLRQLEGFVEKLA